MQAKEETPVTPTPKVEEAKPEPEAKEEAAKLEAPAEGKVGNISPR